jgi:glycosyltransferase involved in cell wall biosynthesis
MQLQAMAVGRPVMACRFAGLQEFLSDHVGYCIDFGLEPADERYAGLGMWAMPEFDSLVSQMRRVYENRNEAAALGERASVIAHRLTWENSNKRLENILRQLGAL